MTNQVQKAEKQEVARKPMRFAYVDQMQDQWAKVLPSVITPERFARVALSALSKTPKLQDALKTPQGKVTLSTALMNCAELGIEPNGRLAHLIPYRNNHTGGYDVQLIIDYKGIVELVMRSGQVARIHADKVCKNDEFEFNKGIVVTHRIDFQQKRGKPYAYYAEVTFKDGNTKAEAMDLEDIEAIRRRSKSPDKGPWVTDFDEMAKKTVFKRLSKWLSLSPEVARAIEIDNEHELREMVNVTPRKSRFERPALIDQEAPAFLTDANAELDQAAEEQDNAEQV